MKGCDSLNKSVVGMNIKQARKKKKMKQKELANLIGYTESSISKYEQGLVDIPNTVIGLIARALDVSPVELLGESWESEFNPDSSLAEETKILESIKSLYGDDVVKLLQQFQQLNLSGKQKFLSDLEDMTMIPKYQK